MTYIVTKGTHAKVITLEATPKVQNWITKNHHSFEAGLISNLVMDEKINLARRNPSTSGYALFGGDSGTDNKARYILAVPYYKLQKLKETKSN
jgi:hypothetical protein